MLLMQTMLPMGLLPRFELGKIGNVVQSRKKYEWQIGSFILSLIM